MSLCILIGAHILVLRLCAKKKGTGVYMYVLSYSIEHVVVIKDCFVEFIYWWEFICELSNPSPFGVCLVHFVRERDEWPFPRDSGLLSLLSFHPLVIWSFSMSWFEQISACLISFRPIVLHTLFHSPCLHCFSFISIHILYLIFLLHHRYSFATWCYFFLPFHHRYIHIRYLYSSLIHPCWTSLGSRFMRFSAHIAFWYTRVWVWSLGIWA